MVFALMQFKIQYPCLNPSTMMVGMLFMLWIKLVTKKFRMKTWLEGIALREAMGKLNQREKLILTLRFFEGRTQMEVADEIGISQAQVSRLEKTALNHMRKHI